MGVPFSKNHLKAAERPGGFGTACRAGAVGKLLRNIPEAVEQAPISIADWRRRAPALPYSLTSDQEKAVEEIAADLRCRRPMRRLLSGDVGTGKTVVYALAALSVIDAGGRVAIMLPGQALAQQVHREILEYWPDIAPVAGLYTVETDGVPDSSRLLIGTTALLFRDTGAINLLVVDEQQRFSREQREKMLSAGTHLLEVSATCIPRTQALAKYGCLAVSQLTTCHVAKEIRTRIRLPSDRANLFRAVKASLDRRHQILVVYPKRAKGSPGAAESDDELPDAETAFAVWNRLFPGKVRLLHRDMDGTAKAMVLADMRHDRADILVATTVVEVGLTLPRLRRIVVVHAERFGLVTLHQLRGRVARTGGVGYCDLYLPQPVKDDVLDRLQILVDTQDGFEVAAADLRLRGFGDLATASGKQTGSDDTFLFGRPLNSDVLDSLLESGTWALSPQK